MPRCAVRREARRGIKASAEASAREARWMERAMWSKVQAESTRKSAASWAAPRRRDWRKAKEAGRRRVRGRRESVVMLES